AAALAYLAWSTLLQIGRQPRQRDYALLGAVLALAYFARTPMFVVGCVILLFLAIRRPAAAGWTGLLVASLVFVLLTAPFVAAISRARGHLTIGDNGKLNHAWLANPGGYIIPNRHWQGGPTGYGAPRHA